MEIFIKTWNGGGGAKLGGIPLRELPLDMYFGIAEMFSLCPLWYFSSLYSRYGWNHLKALKQRKDNSRYKVGLK